MTSPVLIKALMLHYSQRYIVRCERGQVLRDRTVAIGVAQMRPHVSVSYCQRRLKLLRDYHQLRRAQLCQRSLTIAVNRLDRVRAFQIILFDSN